MNIHDFSAHIIHFFLFCFISPILFSLSRPPFLSTDPHNYHSYHIIHIKINNNRYTRFLYVHVFFCIQKECSYYNSFNIGQLISCFTLFCLLIYFSFYLCYISWSCSHNRFFYVCKLKFFYVCILIFI